MKLKPEDLEKISERMKASTTLRDGKGRAKITVHMGTCGIASGAREIMKAFMKQIEDGNIKDVIFTTSGCAGLCSHEPMATVELAGEAPVKYVKLTDEKVAKIFQEHVMGGKAVPEFALGKGSERIG
ncbi:MAG: (2Fe-2S) ferredoxin domain-containing protein [Spirochaetales bacterium]|nr:MAG: (2Fe-2S) ferredoxin domain-containing protein [Spirochaetales bacterium]